MENGYFVYTGKKSPLLLVVLLLLFPAKINFQKNFKYMLRIKINLLHLQKQIQK